MMTLLKTIDLMPSALEQASQKLHECRCNNSWKNCRKSKKNCTKRTSCSQTKPLPTSVLHTSSANRKRQKLLLLHSMLEQVWFQVSFNFSNSTSFSTSSLYVSFDLSMCSMIKCTVYTEVFLQHYIALQHPYFQWARNILRAALLHAGCPQVISKNKMCQQLTTCRPCCRPSWQRPGDTSSLMHAIFQSGARKNEQNIDKFGSKSNHALKYRGDHKKP